MSADAEVLRNSGFNGHVCNESVPVAESVKDSEEMEEPMRFFRGIPFYSETSPAQDIWANRPVEGGRTLQARDSDFFGRCRGVICRRVTCACFEDSQPMLD